MKKRYEVRGMMEWHPVFKAGRSRLQVAFTGGHLCGGASSPATFETSDPVVQTIIEGSIAFQKKMITIGMVADSESATAPHNQNLVVMEFANEGQAKDFMTMKKGLPSDKVYDFQACIAEALKLGIELRIKQPNP